MRRGLLSHALPGSPNESRLHFPWCSPNLKNNIRPVRGFVGPSLCLWKTLIQPHLSSKMSREAEKDAGIFPSTSLLRKQQDVGEERTDCKMWSEFHRADNSLSLSLLIWKKGCVCLGGGAGGISSLRFLSALIPCRGDFQYVFPSRAASVSPANLI